MKKFKYVLLLIVMLICSEKLFAQNGLRLASEDSKYGFKNENGEYVIEPQFDYARNFHEDRAAVGNRYENHAKYGFIDEKGNIRIEAKYDDAGDFSEGLARVKVGKFRLYRNYYLWGFVDAAGKTVIKPRFSFVNDFHEGLACFENYNWIHALFNGIKYGYIDKRNEIVIKAKFNFA
ncbi:MAG: WG repeat-containing protein, partial [Calditrichia bacterium]